MANIKFGGWMKVVVEKGGCRYRYRSPQNSIFYIFWEGRDDETIL